MSNTSLAPAAVARRVHDDGADDLTVLDVRNEEAYEEWRIEGSTNLPVYDELLEYDYSTLEEHLDDLPADEDLAVVCVAGVTSSRAAAFLREHGFDARSVENGMHGWGRVHREHEVEGVDGVVQVVRPGTGCVSYLVHDGDEALVVDPSQHVERYLAAADERDLEVVGVADTHAHADHVSGARRLAGELDVPYYLHADDAGALDRVAELADGETIAVGDREVTVHHTPGHTPGSVSLRAGDALLAGDTLFLRSVGRPDLEGAAQRAADGRAAEPRDDGSEETVREATSRLFDSLDDLTDAADDTVVLPGHFDDAAARPVATELGTLREETSNELLGYVEADEADAFVETIVDGLADEPANYNAIKQINHGEEQPGSDVEALELGPNNCAAN